MCYTDYCYTYMFHWYTDTPMHGLPHVIISCYHHHMDSRQITVTHACMVSLFLSYGLPFILLVFLFHVIVFMLYDCFLLLIWILPLLDMRAVDMRYVDSHIYCSRFPLYCSRYIVPVILFSFPVILFYAINRAQVQLSCYLYHVLYLFLLHCILDISAHKVNLGMGET